MRIIRQKLDPRIFERCFDVCAHFVASGRHSRKMNHLFPCAADECTKKSIHSTEVFSRLYLASRVWPYRSSVAGVSFCRLISRPFAFHIANILILSTVQTSPTSISRALPDSRWKPGRFFAPQNNKRSNEQKEVDIKWPTTIQNNVTCYGAQFILSCRW